MTSPARTKSSIEISDDLILGGIEQGIMAFDCDEKLVRCNSAAVTLLKLTETPELGTPLGSCISNDAIKSFIRKALKAQTQMEEDITLSDHAESFVHAYSGPLTEDKTFLGVVVVFYDITRLRHLENVRRDFVANVSHELKTPVTSIKGFVETLLDGALANREDAERFLTIIKKQADRLNAIFEDLLLLARIEQHEDAQLELSPSSLLHIVEAAIQDCAPEAERKSISITVVSKTERLLPVNAQLLEQAVVNLIDNAIKYSPNDTAVQVSIYEKEKEMVIEVKDQGAGIAEDHLSRIWERFYRVDQARSRKMGGTGLGLAIVKHIAKAHEGYVELQSTLGIGSTFSIYLPQKIASS